MGPELKPTIPPLGTTTRKGLCSFQGASGKQGCQTIVLAGALRRPDPPRSNNLLISLGNEISLGNPPPLFLPPACLPPVPILKGGVTREPRVYTGTGRWQEGRGSSRPTGRGSEGRAHGKTEHRPRGRTATRSTGHADARQHGAPAMQTQQTMGTNTQSSNAPRGKSTGTLPGSTVQTIRHTHTQDKHTATRRRRRTRIEHNPWGHA